MKKNLNYKKVIMILLGISVFFSVIMLLLYNYWDGQTLLAWSVSNWDLLVEGRLRDFYTDKLVNLRGAIHPDGCGNPFMLVPIMLWNFPIWITHYFNGNYFVGTLPCIYWYKVFLLIITGVLALGVYKIIIKFGNTSELGWIGVLLIMASPEILLSTMYSGQDEVVYLALFVWAFYAKMLEKEKCFYFLSLCAITCCPLMMLPFLVVLICSQKNIFKILIACLGMLIPTALWEIFSIGAKNKSYLNLNSGSFIADMMNRVEIPTSTGVASLSAILIICLLFVVYFYAENDYTNPINNPMILWEKSIWYMTIAFVILSFLMENMFYRLLLYVPFLVVLILIRDKQEANVFNLFIVTVLSYCRLLMSGYNSPQTLNTIYVAKSPLLLKVCALTGSNKYEVYDALFDKLVEKIPMLNDLATMINAVIIMCIIILLFCNHPWQKKEYKMQGSSLIILSMYVACIPLAIVVFMALLLK